VFTLCALSKQEERRKGDALFRVCSDRMLLS